MEAKFVYEKFMEEAKKRAIDCITQQYDRINQRYGDDQLLVCCKEETFKLINIALIHNSVAVSFTFRLTTVLKMGNNFFECDKIQFVDDIGCVETTYDIGFEKVVNDNKINTYQSILEGVVELDVDGLANEK